MWFPVDLPTPSEHFVLRTQTSMSTTPFSKSLLLPLSWRTLDTKSELSGKQDGRDVSQFTYAKTTKRNTGLVFSPSAGLWISGLFNEEFVASRNVPDSGTYMVSGALEEFLLREALVRVGVEISPALTLGIALRGQSIKGDVLGSFTALGTERTLYTGRRMGVAAAAMLTVQSVKAAARYEAPVTGKVDIAGESKVSSEAGYLGAAVNFSQSADVQIRGEFGLYEFAKNELGASIRAPSTTRQFNISPLGLAVDARLVPLSVLGAGIQGRLGSSWRAELDLVQGKVFYVSDSEMLPPKSIGESEKGKVYSARLGIALDKTDWESQLFVDYAQMKATRVSAQANLNNTITQWGVGLRAGIEL
jgi:hypothetical protein